MTDQPKRPPENRWWCPRCRVYVADERVEEGMTRAAQIAADVAEALGREPVEPQPGHRVRETTARNGWVTGSRLRFCAPVERVEVGSQEQFVKWLEGT